MAALDKLAASRLCNACGLCCNGVMFHKVQLQPRDVAQDLVALGLRIKRKKGQEYFMQPCPAYEHSACSIYPSRPERCRLFQCQQLRRMLAGEICEGDALEKIRGVQRRLGQIEDLLSRAGTTDKRRPLSLRCEKILAEPSFEPAMTEIHRQLAREIESLDAVLDAEFRVVSESSGSEAPSKQVGDAARLPP